jgi:hypothetical protein
VAAGSLESEERAAKEGVDQGCQKEWFQVELGEWVAAGFNSYISLDCCRVL